MIFLQAELLSQLPEDQEQHAIFGLKTLTQCLKELHDDERDLTVITDMAIIDDVDKPGTGAVVEGVGIRGILDAVHCIKVGKRLPTLTYSLGIDAISAFPLDDPDESDLILAGAQAPIVKVNSIETAA